MRPEPRASRNWRAAPHDVALFLALVFCGSATTRPAAAEEAPTWVDEVAPLVHQHCFECHRDGGSAPMPLTSFEQTRPWARSIARQVAAQQMPPWHADGEGLSFANERGLSPLERAVLLEWVAGGARRGAGPEPQPPKAPTSSWRIGDPDLVLELPTAVRIPASSEQTELAYHDYVIDPGFTEDVWVRAAEARPGNAEVVHHIIVGYQIRDPLERRRLAREGRSTQVQGNLGGYVPGDEPLVLPDGLARRIPAGARIYFQMHYTPAEHETTDRSQLGLVFAEGPPQHEVLTGIASNPFLRIPAGAAHTTAEADFVFQRDVTLLSMRPHLHLRGNSFDYRAIRPDGTEELLLRVPAWDFDWQTNYILATPKALPAGTRLLCTASWDNTSANPDNPDPTRTASWGQQTDDEMMIGFFEYYEDSLPRTAVVSDEQSSGDH